MSDERKETFEELQKKGLSKREAAMFAGYSPSYTPPEKPTKRISDALKNRGVTEDKIAETISVGLEAKSRFGLPDHNAITKYLALIGKWVGYEKDHQLIVAMGVDSKGAVKDPERLKEAIQIIEAELVTRDEPAGEDKESK